MLDKKREYREIIRESLIREGYMSKPSFEEKLKEIIDDSFEELPLRLKKKQKIEEGDFDDINELTDEEITEYEKCLPPYIQDLPGSLRSTDPKELQTRIDAIDKRLGEIDDEIEEEDNIQQEAQQTIDDLTEENESLQQNIDEYNELGDRFAEYDEKAQGEAIDECSRIRDDWDSLEKDFDMPESLGMLVRTLDGSFEHKGFLDGAEVQGFHDIADMLDDYAYDMVEGDDGDITYRPVHEMASRIRDFADEHDINKHDSGDTLVEMSNVGDGGSPSEWEDTIKCNRKEIDNQQKIYDDSVKSQERKEKEKED